MCYYLVMKRATKIVLIVLIVVAVLLVLTITVANWGLPKLVVLGVGEEVTFSRLSLALQRGEVIAEDINYREGEFSSEYLSLKVSPQELFALALKRGSYLKTVTLEAHNLATKDLRVGEINLDIVGEIDPFNINAATVNLATVHLKGASLNLIGELALEVEEATLRGEGPITIASLQKGFPDLLADFAEIEVVAKEIKGEPQFSLDPFAAISPWVVDLSNWRIDYAEFYFKPTDDILFALDAPLLKGEGQLHEGEALAIDMLVEDLNDQVRSELALFFLFLGQEIPPVPFQLTLRWWGEGFPLIEFY